MKKAFTGNKRVSEERAKKIADDANVRGIKNLTGLLCCYLGFN
jgi:hypothetical protein